MKCPNCARENIKAGAIFCPDCGVTLDSSSRQTTGDGGQQSIKSGPAAREVPKKGKLKSILIGLAVIVLLSAGTVAYFFNPLGPDKKVNEFLMALQSEQYEKAYGYFDDSDFIGQRYLSLESFKTAFSNKKVLDYKLTMPSNTSDDYMLPVKADVVLSLGGDRKELKLTLVNKGNRYLPQWKIQPGPFEVKSNVSTLSGIKVALNDNEVTLDRGKASIPMFINLPVKAEFSSPDVKTVTINGVAGDNLSVNAFQPSEQLGRQLGGLIVNYNNEWIKAVYNKSTDPITQYIKLNSKRWTEDIDYINRLKQSSNKEVYKIKDIKTGTPVFTSGFDRVTIDTNEAWSVDTQDSTGRSIRYEDRLINWRYTLEKQDNNRWLITESNKI
ncbi:MAG: zinc ribbon domain-containing protein [Firmicutes bacterium]|nr:zinc ribbon domain-containing protein [Bacillota bacterium]